MWPVAVARMQFYALPLQYTQLNGNVRVKFKLCSHLWIFSDAKFPNISSVMKISICIHRKNLQQWVSLCGWESPFSSDVSYLKFIKRDFYIDGCEFYWNASYLNISHFIRWNLWCRNNIDSYWELFLTETRSWRLKILTADIVGDARLIKHFQGD